VAAFLSSLACYDGEVRARASYPHKRRMCPGTTPARCPRFCRSAGPRAPPLGSTGGETLLIPFWGLVVWGDPSACGPPRAQVIEHVAARRRGAHDGAAERRQSSTADNLLATSRGVADRVDAPFYAAGRRT